MGSELQPSLGVNKSANSPQIPATSPGLSAQVLVAWADKSAPGPKRATAAAGTVKSEKERRPRQSCKPGASSLKSPLGLKPSNSIAEGRKYEIQLKESSRRLRR